MSAQVREKYYVGRALRRHLGLLVGVTVGAMVISGVVSLFLPPVYRSSLVIEIGEIFIPQEENIKVEAEPLEEPMSVVEVLSSPAFLAHTREELGIKASVESLGDQLEVEQVIETTRFQRTESPLVRMTFEGGDPAFNVRILESLASQLVAEHERQYASSLRMLEGRIKNLQEKIEASRRLIERLEKYQEGLEKTIALVEEGVRDYTAQLDKVDLAATNRTEALFLKSTLNSMKEQIIESRREYNEASISIGEEEEKIQESRDRISNLENLIALTKNTKIRAAAVLAEEPVRPLVLVNVLVAGALALLLSFFFVIFREYSLPPA